MESRGEYWKVNETVAKYWKPPELEAPEKTARHDGRGPAKNID